MELFKLVQFIAAAENKSMTKAAEQLYISQPAVSKNISSLEEELGCELFIRDNNKLYLTSEGAYLLNEGKQLIAKTEEVKQNIINMKKDKGNDLLLIASGDDFIRFFFADYISESNLHIDTKLSYATNSKTIIDSSGADIILAGEFPKEEEYMRKLCAERNLERIFFYTMRLYLLTPLYMPSFGSKVTFEKIKNVPIVKLNMQSGIQKWLDVFEKEMNIRIPTDFECDLTTFITLMKRGDKNIITSSMKYDLFRNEIKNSHVALIDSDIAYKRMCIYYKKDNAKAKKCVERYLQMFYKTLAEHRA